MELPTIPYLFKYVDFIFKIKPNWTYEILEEMLYCELFIIFLLLNRLKVSIY